MDRLDACFAHLSYACPASPLSGYDLPPPFSRLLSLQEPKKLTGQDILARTQGLLPTSPCTTRSAGGHQVSSSASLVKVRGGSARTLPGRGDVGRHASTGVAPACCLT
jgi:hypothetical protein